MIVKQHPGTGLWVTSDGRVILPPCKKYPRFRFTYGHKDNYGYMIVGFRGKLYKVHRLVAGAFLPNPLNLPEIDHINRVRHDNRVFNIRWVDRKTQQSNTQKVEDSLAKYGVRCCENASEYNKARYANNSERVRANSRSYQRERRARDPEYAELVRARNRKWQDKQKALGKRVRKCLDGSKHWLTDEEYDSLYKKD